jgi:Icc-related predicted phosphoesterase
MRLLCVSDIHGKSSSVSEVLRIEKSTGIDIIIVCGDITQLGGYNEAEPIIGLLLETGKPVIAVHGNMDTETVLQYLIDKGLSLHGNTFSFKNVIFEGLGGGNPSPFYTPIEYDEDEITRILSRSFPHREKKSPIVFVSHTPPLGTLLDKIKSGAHVGSVSVRDFILDHKPDLFLCGHIHESMGIDTLGTCTCVNTGPLMNGHYAVIDLDEETGTSIIHRKMIDFNRGR